MKKFVVSLLFLLVSTLGLMLVNDTLNKFLMLSSSANTAYKTYRLFVQCPTDEIGIFGSSRAFTSYAPSLFPVKTFNYGYDGSTMAETLFLVKQALKNSSSMPIIINIEPWGFPKNPEINFVLNYQLALSNKSVFDALPPSKKTISDRIPGVRFHGMFRQNLGLYYNSKSATFTQIDSGSELHKTIRTPKEWKALNEKLRTTPHEFNENSYFESELVKIYESTSRPIVLIVSPCSKAWIETFTGEPQLINFLNRQKQHSNVYTLNFCSSNSCWDNEFFRDPTHLNLTGAKRFTIEVINRLKTCPKLGKYFR
ncbi:MAG: hypothetical protein IJV69_00785 [Kiritimatiellae bacterium]|nr:hypothetical protein [Kiritimatiellia bacterium]